ncbi:MAG TPA: hypothetical protein ENJ80_04295 [Gammaproteobacteria bacterium]|nr:hypothetical protein [Gammaproteobacteria bacterium]
MSVDGQSYFASFDTNAFVIKNALSRLAVNLEHGLDLGFKARWWSDDSGIWGYIDTDEIEDKTTIAPIIKDVRAGELRYVSPETSTIAVHSNGPVNFITESQITGMSIVEEPACKDSFLWETGHTWNFDIPKVVPVDYVTAEVLTNFDTGFNIFNAMQKFPHELFDASKIESRPIFCPSVI